MILYRGWTVDCDSVLKLLGVSKVSFLVVAAVEGTEGEGLGEVLGGEPPVAYCFKSSSHRARRSWRSWLGRRRLRAGAGVLGVHVTPAWVLRLAHEDKGEMS